MIMFFIKEDSFIPTTFNLFAFNVFSFSPLLYEDLPDNFEEYRWDPVSSPSSPSQKELFFIIVYVLIVGFLVDALSQVQKVSFYSYFDENFFSS